jgi:hypothetical protein
MSSNSNQTFRGKASPDLSGEAYFLDLIQPTTPGTPQTIHSETIPVGFNYNLLKIFASGRHEAIIQVELDGDIISSMRIGPGNINPEFSWQPFRQASAGELLEVKLLSLGGKPSSDVEVFLQARKVTI